MERVRLFYTCGAGHYQRDLQSKRLSHIIVVEHVVHFWRKKSSLSCTINIVDYDTSGVVHGTYPVWKNLMSSVAGLPQEERVYKRKKGISKSRLLMRLKPKNISWTECIVQ